VGALLVGAGLKVPQCADIGIEAWVNPLVVRYSQLGQRAALGLGQRNRLSGQPVSSSERDLEGSEMKWLT
jgi:hypothetical protein